MNDSSELIQKLVARISTALLTTTAFWAKTRETPIRPKGETPRPSWNPLGSWRTFGTCWVTVISVRRLRVWKTGKLAQLTSSWVVRLHGCVANVNTPVPLPVLPVQPTTIDALVVKL